MARNNEIERVGGRFARSDLQDKTDKSSIRRAMSEVARSLRPTRQDRQEQHWACHVGGRTLATTDKRVQTVSRVMITVTQPVP